jgi:hypothetical protein
MAGQAGAGPAINGRGKNTLVVVGGCMACCVPPVLTLVGWLRLPAAAQDTSGPLTN